MLSDIAVSLTAVKVYNHTITGSGETDDMTAAMGIALDKVKGQLKKFKGKLKEKKS